MNLRPRCFNNRIMARAQAAVIALTYIFLCTFGMLTHTHASEEAYAEHLLTPESVARCTAPSSTRLRAPFSDTALTAASHCPFCDWQANNHARPVLPLRLVAPLTLVLLSLKEATPVAPVLLLHSSSRAPPVVGYIA